MLAERGLCSNTSKVAFLLLFHTLKQSLVYLVKPKSTFWTSRQRKKLYWRLETQRKEKATEQWPRSLVKELERSTGQTTEENRLMPKGEKDSGRGIKYARRNPQESGKVNKFPLIKQVSATFFISASNFLSYSTTRITACSWYYVIVHLQMAEVCTTNLKVTPLLKALLSGHSTW